MAIRNLNERYPELGRIRLGDRELMPSKKERPRKLTQLRFTSNDEVALKALASQHGGDVKPWEKGEQTFELYTETALVPVMLPPDPLGDTPIYERWGSGGVQRRCDGERCLIPRNTDDGGEMVEVDCVCLSEGLIPGDNKEPKACKVTIRLRLVLPDVPGLGVWLCTSHSWIGALELPGQVALLDSLRSRGQLIPAEFGIEQRTVKKPWESFTREFIVPVIRVRQSLTQITAGQITPPALAARPVAIAAPEPKAIDPTPPPRRSKADSAELVREMAALSDNQRKTVSDDWRAAGLPPMKDPLTAEQIAEGLALVAKIKAVLDPERPFDPPSTTDQLPLEKRLERLTGRSRAIYRGAAAKRDLPIDGALTADQETEAHRMLDELDATGKIADPA